MADLGGYIRSAHAARMAVHRSVLDGYLGPDSFEHEVRRRAASSASSLLRYTLAKPVPLEFSGTLRRAVAAAFNLPFHAISLRRAGWADESAPPPACDVLDLDLDAVRQARGAPV